MEASGCAQGGKIDPLAGGGGISGNWLPDGGGYTAVFDNGRFSTTATDPGNVISQGSYIAISGMEVELSWTSNITGLEIFGPNTSFIQDIAQSDKQYNEKQGSYEIR